MAQFARRVRKNVSFATMLQLVRNAERARFSTTVIVSLIADQLRPKLGTMEIQRTTVLAKNVSPVESAWLNAINVRRIRHASSAREIGI